MPVCHNTSKVTVSTSSHVQPVAAFQKTKTENNIIHARFGMNDNGPHSKPAKPKKLYIINLLYILLQHASKSNN